MLGVHLDTAAQVRAEGPEVWEVPNSDIIVRLRAAISLRHGKSLRLRKQRWQDGSVLTCALTLTLAHSNGDVPAKCRTGVQMTLASIDVARSGLEGLSASQTLSGR